MRCICKAHRTDEGWSHGNYKGIDESARLEAGIDKASSAFYHERANSQRSKSVEDRGQWENWFT